MPGNNMYQKNIRFSTNKENYKTYFTVDVACRVESSKNYIVVI